MSKKLIYLSISFCLLVFAPVIKANQEKSLSTNDLINKERAEKTIKRLQRLAEQLVEYRLDCGSYPDDLITATRKNPMCKWQHGITSENIVDKWGNEFAYEKSQETFKLQSYGSDGKPGGKGYAADINSPDHQQYLLEQEKINSLSDFVESKKSQIKVIPFDQVPTSCTSLGKEHFKLASPGGGVAVAVYNKYRLEVFEKEKSLLMKDNVNAYVKAFSEYTYINKNDKKKYELFDDKAIRNSRKNKRDLLSRDQLSLVTYTEVFHCK